RQLRSLCFPYTTLFRSNAFRSRSLSQSSYPILWVDALYEKVRMDGRIVSMAILVVCGVDEHGQRDILAIEPMLEESEECLAGHRSEEHTSELQSRFDLV